MLVHGRPTIHLHVAVYLSSFTNKSVERTKAQSNSDAIPVFGLVQTEKGAVHIYSDLVVGLFCGALLIVVKDGQITLYKLFF